MQDLINCHCKGVDSIILNENPVIRLFIANPDHELWRNDTDEWSVALHEHHCDITIVPVKGFVYNKIQCNDGLYYRLSSFKYESPIKGQGKFTKLNFDYNICLKSFLIDAPLQMRAQDKHTIIVNKGYKAAWMICEGFENLKYDSTCLSNTDLTKFSFEGLYQPMSKEYRQMKLEELSLL